MDIATAAGLEKTLITFCNSIGLSDDIMSKQLIGFCSDGASTMIGEHGGLAALLKKKFPLIKSVHCMAHRLELAVKNTVDTVNPVSHFRILLDAIYSFQPVFQKPKGNRACC